MKKTLTLSEIEKKEDLTKAAFFIDGDYYTYDQVKDQLSTCGADEYMYAEDLPYREKSYHDEDYTVRRCYTKCDDARQEIVFLSHQ